MKHYTLTLKNRQMELGERTCIMGILNITPNSFSDGGRFFDTETALAHAEQMARSGADIIDIGGESTRPFSDPVSPEEEIKRVVPVIEKLSERIDIPISIDTTKASVARQAIAAGAAVINDISGLRLDPEIAEVAAQYGAPLILMHMKGTPKTMQAHPHYDDLIGEIGEFLENAIAKARAAGVPQNRIIADPGIGFGKTLSHNLCLINRLNAFERLDVPILVGSSRKSFIRSLLRKNDQPDIDPAHPRVETGTQATVAAAILRGAHIVRVHDVENTVVTARIIDAIRNVSDNP
ncbi:MULTISPECIES: dihydropteroate synthase [Desulfococcus]|jgi:dihydropteroate synthase|uniref:Dihydropteroate synthase n=1 Tax=Desulfococcus multivorans DSM 2059 TaxID=1121405 RepID=S7TBY9_DESML|nr:dihydropteroate synthase [Desulfococcus multivorans]AOY60658.1 FolP: dihydropteroate synthase [Desulfococcus multivorans]AQV02744.1 dihydropteroate synthase [Desulfococcus multivorans]EPR34682.1 dihydropteroate synthase [Desulfococcus multivorans DSM 2059]SKA02803.1 Dihydropteroate synthase [Desulfococcus multivorans DSM 2059]